LSGAKAQELALPAEPPRLTTAPRRASRRLPTGTVTFLLTEIEGARDLQRDTGAAFQEALERHQTLLREQFGRHGGSEVTEARGCFTVAFARPSDALDCALACQRALAAQSWPDKVGALRVRMALVTGEAELKDGHYRGPVLDRGRGLLLAAHGGQILCSEASASLLQLGLEQAVRLADLGFYRLRDDGGPQRLFAVKYAGMVPETFPAPNAALAYTSNLPHQFTRFFGREEELARLQEELDGLDDDARRDALAWHRAVSHILDNLQAPVDDAPPALQPGLTRMVELNEQTDDYHASLAGTAGLIATLTGIQGGLTAIRRSVEGLQREQEMHSAYLKALSFELPADARAYEGRWEPLAKRFADEKAMSSHPKDFLSAVSPLQEEMLSVAQIEQVFEAYGQAIEAATRDW